MIGTLYFPHEGPAGACTVTARDLAAMIGEINRIHPRPGSCPRRSGSPTPAGCREAAAGRTGEEEARR